MNFTGVHISADPDLTVPACGSLWAARNQGAKEIHRKQGIKR